VVPSAGFSGKGVKDGSLPRALDAAAYGALLVKKEGPNSFRRRAGQVFAGLGEKHAETLILLDENACSTRHVLL